MRAPAVPLTDEQLRTFLSQGFLVLKPDIDPTIHERLRNRIESTIPNLVGNSGNNILPHIPEFQAIFDAPNIRGALESVVGPRHIIHPHRHMHANNYTKGGGWHKDSYWGYTDKIRNHRPWWVMIMYYPQDVTPEMGPTGVLPGSQHHQEQNGVPEENGATSVTGPAGTCFMIQYDIWHRATPNISGKMRYMCKFEFIRLEAPTAQAFGKRALNWEAPAQSANRYPHHGMNRQHWNWLTGSQRPNNGQKPLTAKLGFWLDEINAEDPKRRTLAAEALEAFGPAAEPALGSLLNLLSDHWEPARLNAAYALASIGSAAVTGLSRALRSENSKVQLSAGYALSAMGPEAVETLLAALGDPNPMTRAWAAFGLGEIPSGAGYNTEISKALAQATRDGDHRVRIHAVEGLGQRGPTSAADGTDAQALSAMIDRIDDGNTEARFDAVLALARWGTAAETAVPRLTECLHADNRYVVGYAVEALHQIGTQEALEALIPYLKSMRWCPLTNHQSTFYP